MVLEVYKIKRIQNISESYYDKESYRKAIQDPGIKELCDIGMLCCEYGIPIDNSTIRQQMITQQMFVREL